jgi:O-methyltransferase involved in polyketide biosynthesis
MRDKRTAAPDSTAVRVALWPAMHVQVDRPPHVLEDEIGLRLAAPDEGWRRRPDMDPHFTSQFRASIVARARFIEDLVVERAGHGVGQYVILGAGLDTFAQRRPEIASSLKVFEIDQPSPQAWKRQRLIEFGLASRRGCGSCRSTSRRAMPGGNGWRPLASMPASRRWWLPPASACTSPGTRSWRRCAR